MLIIPFMHSLMRGIIPTEKDGRGAKPKRQSKEIAGIGSGTGWVTRGDSGVLVHNVKCRKAQESKGSDYLKLVHQCMYVLVYHYGTEGYERQQWESVVVKIGLERPDDAAWNALSGWRTWIRKREKASPVGFNRAVVIIDSKIKETIEENELDMHREGATERRFNRLSTEDQAKYKEKEGELAVTRQSLKELPDKQKQELISLVDAVEEAERVLEAAAKLLKGTKALHEGESELLVEKETKLQKQINGLMDRVASPPPSTPKKRKSGATYESVSGSASCKRQRGKNVQSSSSEDDEDFSVGSEHEASDNEVFHVDGSVDGDQSPPRAPEVTPPSLEERMKTRPPSKNQLMRRMLNQTVHGHQLSERIRNQKQSTLTDPPGGPIGRRLSV